MNKLHCELFLVFFFFFFFFFWGGGGFVLFFCCSFTVLILYSTGNTPVMQATVEVKRQRG